MFTKSERDKVTIEHILPQTPDCEYWKTMFDNYSDEEIINFSGAIGNLLPLSQSINSSLQNYSFPEKKGGTIEEGHEVRRGYVNGSHSEIEVSLEEDWGPVQIIERSKRLFDFMKIRWQINISDEQKEQLVYVKVK